MGHVVPYLQLIELLQGDRLFFRIPVSQVEAVVPFENLVVCITAHVQFRGFKTLVKRLHDGSVGYLLADLLKDVVETVGLLFGGAENKIPHPGFLVLPEFVQQQVKLFVEGGLWAGWKFKLVGLYKPFRNRAFQDHLTEFTDRFPELLPTQEKGFRARVGDL